VHEQRSVAAVLDRRVEAEREAPAVGADAHVPWRALNEVRAELGRGRGGGGARDRSEDGERHDERGERAVRDPGALLSRTTHA